VSCRAGERNTLARLFTYKALAHRRALSGFPNIALGTILSRTLEFRLSNIEIFFIDMEAKMGTIYITSIDMKRLKTLIAGSLFGRSRESEYLQRLNVELDLAEVRKQKDIPKDVITMNSKVRLKDLDSNEDLIYTLVYPGHAHFASGQISVLAPIGTAMIGYRVGDVITWPVPAGIRRLQVKEVLYQPEASGDLLR
jgi:regulator of nucleoside diphosphate kinase